jgi:hypothetical protein
VTFFVIEEDGLVVGTISVTARSGDREIGTSSSTRPIAASA